MSRSKSEINKTLRGDGPGPIREVPYKRTA